MLAVRTVPRDASDGARADDAAELDAALQEHATADADTAGHLFRGCVFFLSRETPRDALAFLARACGAVVAWDGEGSPHSVDDAAITHQVVDRPALLTARVPGREYVQPQWLFDSLNYRIRCPTAPYAPGVAPPPHLSPFAPSAADGAYAPDFADTVRRCVCTFAFSRSIDSRACAGGGVAGCSWRHCSTSTCPRRSGYCSAG